MSHRFVRRENDDGYTVDHKAITDQCQRVYTSRTLFPMHEIARLVVPPGRTDGSRLGVMKAFVDFAEGIKP